MAATLEQLVKVRSQLATQILGYLDGLAKEAAQLPHYFPPHLREAVSGLTPFDSVRQMVQVVEDPSAYEELLAEERERRRAAGEDVERLAYDPTRARPENNDGDGFPQEPDRPLPPPPVLWDESAGERFPRAIILGDPGFGKTWLLRYEARRIATCQAGALDKMTISIENLKVPILKRLSDLDGTTGPLEDALVDQIGRRRSEAFRRFVRDRLETGNCVVLLDAWDEVPSR
ncbi:MAG: hypothetical protein JXB46_11560, partial [Candidatus Eisenbacteria bacterium]|nr:hypothetical protein [Candidatus Eisenbacteria bacterium]